jgi:nucleoside-diphosphate-sugar epimerase
LDAEQSVGQTINLGVGASHSVGELVERIARLLGREIEIQTESARLRPAASEVMHLLSDNRKAAELLGWAPQVSLDEGLQATIDWLRAHRDSAAALSYAI